MQNGQAQANVIVELVL